MSMMIKSKLSGDVIDIRQASTKVGALLDAFPQKSSDGNNQLWDFVDDPAGTGYVFIKSALSGNVIDILGADTNRGALLDAYSQKTTAMDNQLWGFVPDPANPGYFFIKSALNGNVIDVQGAKKDAGVLLDAYPRKSTGTDNQLWAPVGGTFPPPPKQLPSTLSFTNLGTGSNTTSSGSTECSYSLNLTVQQDGTCRFWGSYTNRGDVPLITAPNQTWGVSFLLLDTNNKGYSFNTGGNTPSAPQAGCTASWDATKKIPLIAQNWTAIATRHAGNYGYKNETSFLEWVDQIVGLVESLASDVGTAVSDVTEVISIAAAVAG